jgi:hypothetical protein
MFESISALLPWVQYPAAALTIIGFYFIGGKTENLRKTGFTLGLVGNIVWIIYGVLPVQPGIIATNLCIFTLAVRGYLNNSGTLKRSD